jgi:DNA-directed RNA polymerase sigma subunit (sigma70/sigma32)
VDAFVPLIATMAHRHCRGSQLRRDELVQEGVGMLRALARYAPEFGVPFWACASWWVRQARQQQEPTRLAPGAGEICPTS